MAALHGRLSLAVHFSRAVKDDEGGDSYVNDGPDTELK